jgi:hypothetical protein
MRRLGVLVVVVTALLAGSEAAARRPGLTRFSDHVDKVSFSYPSQWPVQDVRDWDIHYTEIVVALSTERLHAPCHRTGTYSVSCGVALMLNDLPPAGVVVVWMIDDSPFGKPTLANDPGTRTQIGGLPAKIAYARRPDLTSTFCPPGTTGSVTAFIAAANHHGPTIMAACTHSANFSRFGAQVQAMLRSASFRG